MFARVYGITPSDLRRLTLREFQHFMADYTRLSEQPDGA